MTITLYCMLNKFINFRKKYKKNKLKKPKNYYKFRKVRKKIMKNS